MEPGTEGAKGNKCNRAERDRVELAVRVSHGVRLVLNLLV